MIAKKASGRSIGGVTSTTTKKTQAAVKKSAAKTAATRTSAFPPPRREKAEDLSDVMKTLDQINAKNDELADRINRLVTSLR